MEAAKTHLLATGSLPLKVTPRAARNSIEGFTPDADGTPRLRVKVTAVAEDGKANEAVIALLAKAFSLPKSHLVIIRGQSGRSKTLAYRP